jgi:hypothetical protein
MTPLLAVPLAVPIQRLAPVAIIVYVIWRMMPLTGLERPGFCTEVD